MNKVERITYVPRHEVLGAYTNNINLPENWNFVLGNICFATENIICHETNTLGEWGAGVALALRIKFPCAYEQYHDYCKQKQYWPKALMGEAKLVLQTEEVNDHWIANLFAQSDVGTYKRQLNYEAFANALGDLADLTTTKDSFAFPYKIGCGLAGGDWDVVYAMIKHYLYDRKVTFYVFQ